MYSINRLSAWLTVNGTFPHCNRFILPRLGSCACECWCAVASTSVCMYFRFYVRIFLVHIRSLLLYSSVLHIVIILSPQKSNCVIAFACSRLWVYTTIAKRAATHTERSPKNIHIYIKHAKEMEFR